MSKRAASDARRELQATDRVVQSGSVLIGSVGGEVVALDLDSGQCFGLNEIGSAIWQRMSAPVSIGELCDSLCRTYDVDRDACEAQVFDLLADLRSEGLITIV